MAKNKAVKTVSDVKIQEMSAAELIVKAGQLKTEVNKKKLEKAVGRLKNLREIYHLRKELARVKTIINIKSESKI